MKLKDSKGSAMLIVILAMALFMIAISIFSSQTNNQIKSTKKHYDNIEAKYLAESGIEKTIADICDTIDNNLNTNRLSRISINQSKSTDKIILYLSQTQTNLVDAKTYTHGDQIKSMLQYAITSIDTIKNNGININSIIGDIFNIRDQINVADSSKDSNNISDTTKFNNEIKSSRNNMYYSLNYIHELDVYHPEHLPADLEMNAIKRISNSIVSDNIYNGSKGLGQIHNDLFNLNQGNGGIKLSNSLFNDINTIRDNIWLQLGSGGASKIDELANYVHYNNIKDRNNEEFQKRVKDISDYIDTQVSKLVNIQVKLDEEYVNISSPPTNLTDKIKEIQTKIESVKYYLFEVKCKLGAHGNLIPEGGNPPTTDGNLPNSLTINSYKFPNESKYTIEGYERMGLNIPININYNSLGVVDSIDPTTINIQSIGYKDNKSYNVKAEVTFNISKQGEVSSYRINKWEKN